MPDLFGRPVELGVCELQLHYFGDPWHQLVVLHHLCYFGGDDAVGQGLASQVVAVVNDQVLYHECELLVLESVEHNVEEDSHLLSVLLEPFYVRAIDFVLVEVDSLRGQEALQDVLSVLSR